MMRRRVRGALVAAGIQAAICLGAIPVLAAGEPQRLGLTPVGQAGTYFDLTLEPGDHRQIEVEAVNYGLERTRARTYAADVYSIVNGGFGAELRGRDAAGPTTWLSYPTQAIALQPQQAVRVPFVVSVPLDTPPGEYITALVIESKEALPSSGPLALNQVNRSAIAVAIDVPGPREPKLSIGGGGHKSVGGHSILTFAVDNPGNVHLWPAGRMVVRGPGGSLIVGLAVVMDAVYAGSSTSLEAALSGTLSPGEYCAQLSLTDAATGAQDATDCLSFIVAPEPSEGSGNRSNPDWLPGTSATSATTVVSVAVLAGVGLIAFSLLLAMLRRAATRERVSRSGTQSGTPAITADRTLD